MINCIRLTRVSNSLVQNSGIFKTQKSPFFAWLNPIFNRVDEKRISEVGPDRAAAEWLIRCGAQVKWKGTEKFHSDYNTLPATNFGAYKIEAIDATESCLMDVGFRYLPDMEASVEETDLEFRERTPPPPSLVANETLDKTPTCSSDSTASVTLNGGSGLKPAPSGFIPLLPNTRISSLNQLQKESPQVVNIHQLRITCLSKEDIHKKTLIASNDMSLGVTNSTTTLIGNGPFRSLLKPQIAATIDTSSEKTESMTDDGSNVSLLPVANKSDKAVTFLGALPRSTTTAPTTTKQPPISTQQNKNVYQDGHVINGTSEVHDPVKEVLDWKDGVARLPGSELRFRLTEFGTLDLIADEAVIAKTTNGKDSQPIACDKMEGNDSGTMVRVLDTIAVAQRRPFSWDTYVEHTGSRTAPNDCFIPQALAASKRDEWEVGQKLEAIDPRDPRRIGVVTIAEKMGTSRLRLKFDGDDSFSFWVNTHSTRMFPAGFCEKSKRKLSYPPGYSSKDNFRWTDYLRKTKSRNAPRISFVCQGFESLPSFQDGDVVEAVFNQVNGENVFYGAKIVDRLPFCVLVERIDVENVLEWVDVCSPRIRPINWARLHGNSFHAPTGDKEFFDWDTFIRSKKLRAAPHGAFQTVCRFPFETGMRVEAVDPYNPQLVRVATVKHCSAYRLKLGFDGWPESFDFWLYADSPDVHPVCWAAATEHPLQVPPGYIPLDDKPEDFCDLVPGLCHGFGHVNGLEQRHVSPHDCPYSLVIQPPPVVDTKPEVIPVKGSVAPPPEPPDLTESTTLSDSSTPPVGGGDGNGANEKPNRGRGRPRKYPVETSVKRDQLKRPSSSCDNLIRETVHKSLFDPPKSDTPPDIVLPDQRVRELLSISSSKADLIAPSKWSAEDTAKFVASLPGCGYLHDVFISEEIDGEAFLLLTQSDLVTVLKIKVGPALKIMSAVRTFQHKLEDR